VKLDIASYIQDLLWEYECVIIPGFGGILASYRPAEMVLAEHTLYPPSKSLAFNEYLTNNDGLLINYIQQKDQISYTEASEQLDAWVRKTRSLLSDNEEIYLPLIGRFHRDIEKKLRFEPDTTVNYLPSSYGLRKVIAEPVLRSRSADTIEALESHRASYALPRANKKWAMAAIIILFLALGTVVNLMYQGVDVKPLNLNAANVLGFLEYFQKPAEIHAEPKTSMNKEVPALNNQTTPISSTTGSTSSSVTNENTATAANTTSTSEPKVVEETQTSSSSAGKKYYIIIGAFKRRANFDNAAAYLKDKHPTEELYEDTSLEKRRIGFYAGDNYQQACEKLKEARKDQQDYWLLVKR
jgi:cell division septation protein DedD